MIGRREWGSLTNLSSDHIIIKKNKQWGRGGGERYVHLPSESSFGSYTHAQYLLIVSFAERFIKIII